MAEHNIMNTNNYVWHSVLNQTPKISGFYRVHLEFINANCIRLDGFVDFYDVDLKKWNCENAYGIRVVSWTCRN